MKMKLLNPFFFLALTILGACNKTNDILIVRDNQISTLVAKSEAESDAIQPVFDHKNQLIQWNQWGLSNNYLINTKNTFFQPSSIVSNEDQIAKNSILAKINWQELSNAQFSKIETVVESFAKQQSTNIQHSQEMIDFVNDSLQNYIKLQNDKLSRHVISKNQYDQIMTDTEDTFLSLMRSIYVEQKILISSSTNYRCLLTEIQNTLTEKQWEEFFSCVYKK